MEQYIRCKEDVMSIGRTIKELFIESYSIKIIVICMVIGIILMKMGHEVLSDIFGLIAILSIVWLLCIEGQNIKLNL